MAKYFAAVKRNPIITAKVLMKVPPSQTARKPARTNARMPSFESLSPPGSFSVATLNTLVATCERGASPADAALGRTEEAREDADARPGTCAPGDPSANARDDECRRADPRAPARSPAPRAPEPATAGAGAGAAPPGPARDALARQRATATREVGAEQRGTATVDMISALAIERRGAPPKGT